MGSQVSCCMTGHDPDFKYIIRLSQNRSLGFLVWCGWTRHELSLARASRSLARAPRSLARAPRSYDRASRSQSRYALKSSTCEQVQYIIGHINLKSLNDLLVSFEFRNLIGCERREERDLNENASSSVETTQVAQRSFSCRGSQVSFIFSALSRVPARSHFRHLNFSLMHQLIPPAPSPPPPAPPRLTPRHQHFLPWICRYTIINIYEIRALCCLLPCSPVRCPSAQQRRDDGGTVVTVQAVNQPFIRRNRNKSITLLDSEKLQS